MEITHLGHSSFRLKGKKGIVVTDPFSSNIGVKFPAVTADIVTISHDHDDHNNSEAVKPTPNRDEPFIISAAGEYEVSGISVFGFSSFHDDEKGVQRGKNTIYSIRLDDLNIVHLGDLGHGLSESFIEDLGEVDILLCPVGGFYTISAKTAVEIIQDIEPSYVIPMHYKTDKLDPKVFGELDTVEVFQKEFGVTSEPVKSLTCTATTLPEQTTLVVLEG